MNTIFDINRFGKLLETEFLANKSSITKILLALTAGLLLLYYFIAYIAEFPILILNFLPVLWLMIFLAPLFLYYNMYDKVKSVNFAMLPASILEKFIAIIVQTSIVVPLLLTVVFWVFFFIVSLIPVPEGSHADLNVHFEHILKTIRLQSFLFLAVFWFKENKIRNIIITLIAAMLIFNIADYFIVNNVGLYNFVYKSSFSDFFANYGDILIAVLFPLAPWIIAYKKFTKTQI